MISEEQLINSQVHGFNIMSTWAVMVDVDEYELSYSNVSMRALIDNYELFL